MVLPIGSKERQAQLVRRASRADVLSLSPATEEWLRRGYERRMNTAAVRRDLGEILAHGEPESGMGQGEAAEQPPEEPAVDPHGEATGSAAADGGREDAEGNGAVVIDFTGVGPEAA